MILAFLGWEILVYGVLEHVLFCFVLYTQFLRFSMSKLDFDLSVHTTLRSQVLLLSHYQQ